MIWRIAIQSGGDVAHSANGWPWYFLMGKITFPDQESQAEYQDHQKHVHS
jgi:hypothetical protein